MTKRKTTKEQAAVDLCYCGPEINHVKPFEVFDAIPQGLQEAATDCPAVIRLIVNVSKMAETRKRTLIPGTPEAAYYRAIQTYRKGGKK